MSLRIYPAMAFLALSNMAAGAGAVQQPRWVSGYWYSPPVWGGLPVADIDFSGLTHVIHYSVMPAGDGSLDAQSLKYVTDYAPALIAAAHSHGVKVLLSLAQSDPRAEFLKGTAPGALPALVSHLMDVVRKFGYDGIDVDWETSVDAARFVSLVTQLRLRLNAMTPRGELAGAFWEAAPWLIDTQAAFDQINVMTYDMCSPQEGFAWYNSALHDAGDSKRRSIDKRLRSFTAAIPSRKLGLGIPFYGYVWSNGKSAPGQPADKRAQMSAKSYSEIVSDPGLWRDSYRHRDSAAGQVPYLLSADNRFVTYDDETSVTEKVRYAKSQNLGGLMIWELSGDYMPAATRKHPLLRAIAAER